MKITRIEHHDRMIVSRRKSPDGEAEVCVGIGQHTILGMAPSEAMEVGEQLKKAAHAADPGARDSCAYPLKGKNGQPCGEPATTLKDTKGYCDQHAKLVTNPLAA